MITIDLQRPVTPEEARDNQLHLNEVTKRVFKAKKATVLTGAGISCNAGIPDFRLSDGLYNLVKAKFPATKLVVKGQDLFDILLFRDETLLQIFCTFMALLYRLTCEARPTETHKFIKVLRERNKLLRCYTQNIDGLERHTDLKMGIDLNEFTEKTFTKSWRQLDVVQLHGNLHKLTCTLCFTSFDWLDDYHTALAAGMNPECAHCHRKYVERLYAGKRITGGTVGMLRPNIVLYGENHPQAEILAQGLSADVRARPDLLIIMGTSLKVDGVKKLVRLLAASVHQRGGKVVFVNKTPLGRLTWHDHVDYEILCDCDHFVRILKKEVPDLFLTQEQLDLKRLRMNQLKEERAQIKREKAAKKEEERVKKEAEAGLKEATIKTETGLVKQEVNGVDRVNQAKQAAVKLEGEPIIKQEVTFNSFGSDFSPPSPDTPSKKKRPAPKLERLGTKHRVLSPEPSFTEDDMPLRNITPQLNTPF